MSINYQTEAINIDYQRAYEIEKNPKYNTLDEYIHALNASKYKSFAFKDNELVGLARALSEGVETAYIIGAFAIDDDKEIKSNLIKELEKFLEGKRKMLLSKPDDIEIYEELGYLRCKNAYIYINFDIVAYQSYLLPAQYRFETEFYREPKPKKEPLKVEITYKKNIDNVSFDDINDLLTKAFFNHPHDINKTTLAFNNSDYFEAAFDKDRLVGIARAITDGYYATILNVAIDPDYQGLNIGRTILLNLSKQLGNSFIVLNTHAGSAGFYNKIKEYRRSKTVLEKGFSSNNPFPKINEMFLPKGFKFIDEY